MGGGTPAIAYEDAVDATTTDDAVELTFVRRGGEIGIAPGSPKGGGGRGPSCTYTLQEIAAVPDLPYDLPPRPNPESRAYMLFCDGTFVRDLWIGPQNLLDEDAVGRQIAERIVRELAVPAVSVAANPREGLAGLDSWFWVEGYDGAPMVRQAVELGLTVDVRITRGQVTWDFGDGTPAVTGDLGRAYPARSTVRHVYTIRSTDGPFRVTAQFDLRPEYRVNGGPWQTLPGIGRAASMPYQVREVQAVID